MADAAITLDKVLSRQALELINKFPDAADKGIRVGLFQAGQDLRSRGVQLAPYNTGNLKRSITVEPKSPAAIKDKVQVGSNLDYARIQDQGGVITPKRKKYLRFKYKGQWRTVKRVKIPKYKGKGYLTPAFKEVTK